MAATTEKLIRADTWWRLKRKLEKELIGKERIHREYGFKTDE